MTKWHNGPNGPGICRAKQDNCPFGSADSHYNSKDEATQAYEIDNEKKFGMLPGINQNDSIETEVRAYNSHGISLAINEYLISKLKESNMNSYEMIKSLNNDDSVHGQWKIKEDNNNKITLETRDPWGNIQYVDIKKIEPKTINSHPGKINSHNKNGIPTSLSNYVSLGPGGYEESNRYFENLVKKSNLNSDKLINLLNNDSRIFDKWNLETEDDNSMKLKTEDNLGNVNYITISKK